MGTIDYTWGGRTIVRPVPTLVAAIAMVAMVAIAATVGGLIVSAITGCGFVRGMAAAAAVAAFTTLIRVRLND